MDTPAIFPVIEELRERIRRLEGAAGRRRLVLPFGIKATAVQALTRAVRRLKG